MRGFVLRFPRRSKTKNKVKIPAPRLKFKEFLSRYGLVAAYTLSFGIGMLMGAICARGADSTLLESMDLLFSTNLEARLSQPMYMTFVSSFASNFLFLLFVFLCGLSLWGVLFVFAAPMFKGFGTGLSAGCLFLNYGLRGVGFYLLVMLCGLFIFCFVLILHCTQSHLISFKLFRYVLLEKGYAEGMTVYLRGFLMRSLYMLLASAVASVVDMLLWTAFAKVFF